MNLLTFPLSDHGCGMASNYCHAEGVCTVICQGWGDDLLSETDAGLGTVHCEWPVPDLSPAWTTLHVAVYAEHEAGGGGGVIRFNAGDADLDLNIAAGAADWYEGTLDLPASADYYIVQMTVAGDGTKATIVHELTVDYEPLASPLASGMSGDVCPFDSDEFLADCAVSSDIGGRLVDNLDSFLGRRKVYLNWSAIAGASNIQPDLDESVWHRVWVPALRGTRQNQLALRVHVRATTDATDPTYLYVHGGEQQIGNQVAEPNGIRIDFPAGDPPDTWYTTEGSDPIELVLWEQPAIAGVSHPMAQLGVWPGTREAAGVGDFSQNNPQNANKVAPLIHSICAFGL